MTDKLIVTDTDNGTWALAWESDGEQGTIVGEDRLVWPTIESVKKWSIESVKKGLAKMTNRDNRDCFLAVQACLETPHVGARKDTPRGFEYKVKKDAEAARKAANALIQLDRKSKTWPDWAVQAAAAGWKPPKSWKP